MPLTAPGATRSAQQIKRCQPSLCGNSRVPPCTRGVKLIALADAVRSWCFVVDQLGMAVHKINGTDRVPDIGGLSC
jgi:hypothetical protein